MPSPWRDPWCWASAAAILPLIVRSLGAQLGEPVAEDFDFLHHGLLLGRHSLLDGGGSESFWRPIAHQLYYWLFGPLMLAHPRVLSAFHIVLLMIAAVILYRTLRPWWSGPAAAMAASFPLLAESTRTLISWPSHFVDLGSFLFAIIALHEATRSRLGTCLAALAAALLCKEVALAAVLLVPFVPRLKPVRPAERVRWGLACGLLALSWGAAYLWVRRSAGLALPHHLEAAAALHAAPPWARLAWAARNSLRAVVSLPAAGARGETWILAAFFLVPMAAVAVLARSSDSRRKMRGSIPWMAWGFAWFALATAALATIYPIWAPNRSLFGALGLGIGLVGLLDAAGPALLGALLVARLAAFALSPAPPRMIATSAPDRGAFMDFERLTRLQLLMADTRQALRHSYPTLPRGACVGFNYLPLGAEYAFGGDRALQVWYRDTTLRWVGREEYSSDTTLALAAVVQFQPDRQPQIAMVRADAMRLLLRACAQLKAGACEPALANLARADSLESDTTAAVFHGTVHALRATYWYVQNQIERAVREAREALALDPALPEPHFVLAGVALRSGNETELRSEYDELLVVAPGDQRLSELRQDLEHPR